MAQGRASGCLSGVLKGRSRQTAVHMLAANNWVQLACRCTAAPPSKLLAALGIRLQAGVHVTYREYEFGHMVGLSPLFGSCHLCLRRALSTCCCAHAHPVLPLGAVPAPHPAACNAPRRAAAGLHHGGTRGAAELRAVAAAAAHPLSVAGLQPHTLCCNAYRIVLLSESASAGQYAGQCCE